MVQRITNKYSLTSPAFTGEVLFEFDINTGMLLSVDIQAELSTHQHHFLIANIPPHVSKFDALKTGNAKVTKINMEVTFDMFWERYNNKQDKEVAKRRWNNLSKADQIKAYNYITRYDRYLSEKPSLDKMYPSTYLNKQRWND